MNNYDYQIMNNLKEIGRMGFKELFQKSLIVAAHPDDEILWFSSILDKVDGVVLCFLGSALRPEWGTNRERSLKEHPRKDICCLGLTASGPRVDWDNPVVTEFGLEISKDMSDENYKINYYDLKQQLGKLLKGYHNIFTHNPWGEYGHPEHVQVWRAIQELKKEMRFNLWFTNYCSHVSAKLMLQYLLDINYEYITFETNRALFNDIKEIYKRHDCWTWYDDSECLKEETFLKGEMSKEKDIKVGKMIPINFIRLDTGFIKEKKKNVFHLLFSKILKNRKADTK